MMDQSKRGRTATQPSDPAKHAQYSSKAGESTRAGAGSGVQESDLVGAPDVSSTPVMSRHQAPARTPVAATPGTPQECASMVNAVEEAIKNAHEVTPESGGTASRLPNLQAWLEASGVQLPTPAAKDLTSLAAAAADSKRLRKQLEAMREAELELAAREAEESAQTFSMLEEENLSLAADNARLQQQIAELEALTLAGSAAEAAGAPSDDEGEQWVDGVEARAVMALQRAASTRRLSGVYEEQQLASFRQLDEAEEQLSAVKSQRPGSSHSQQADMQQRLLQAEHEVQAAAAAAQEASQKLQLVLDEKEKVHQELQAIKQQLEEQPRAQRHAACSAELYQKLVDAQQVMQEEKQLHQRLTGSLLEHAGRLSHKYYTLSDDYGVLQQRYRHLASTHEQLAHQLKEAHEALFELQATVQATPPAKRREQQHLLTRVQDAEQAVKSLAQDKSQLQERLLQAQAFMACLQRRTGSSAQQQQPPGGQETPMFSSAAQAWPTPAAAAPAIVHAVPTVPADAAGLAQAPGAGKVATDGAMAAGAAAPETFGGFITPVKGRSNPLFNLPATPGSEAQGGSAAAGASAAHTASFPQEPVSPILAAAVAAFSACAGQQQRQQQIQFSAASHELQHVQQEQLGLRQGISKVESALADIKGQLRARVGAPAASAASAAARAASIGTRSSDSRGSVAGAARKGSSTSAGSISAAGAAAGSGSRPSSKRSSAGSSGGGSITNSQRNRPPNGPTPASVVPAASKSASSCRASVAKQAPAAASTAAATARQSVKPPAKGVATSTAASAAAHITLEAERSALSSAEQQQQRPGRGGSGAKDFAFPCLGLSSEQQPLLLSAAAASRAGEAAPGGSPCESTGSIGSSGSSQHGIRVKQVQPQALAAAGAACSSAIRSVGGAAAAVAALPQPAAAPHAAASEQQQQQHDATRSSSISHSQSRSRAGPAVSAASLGSKAKGSLSLEQLVADAESVSLEYGMSPHQGGAALDDTASTAPSQVQHTPGMQGQFVAGPAMTQESGCSKGLAAAGVWGPEPSVNPAAAAAEYSAYIAQQQQQLLLQTPCSAVASSGGPMGADEADAANADVAWLLQQEQLMRERLANCMADTPGSASSSAGAGLLHRQQVATAARQWLLQQQPTPQQVLAPDVGASGCGPDSAGLVGVGAADMQSAVRPSGAGSRARATAALESPLQMQLEMQLAATPAGAERVASNLIIPQQERLEPSPIGSARQQQQQQQQRSLLTPSFATPTLVANQLAAAGLRGRAAQYSQATADDATSGTTRQQVDDQAAAGQGLGTSDAPPLPLHWMATPQDDAAAAPGVAGSESAAAATPAATTAASSSQEDEEEGVVLVPSGGNRLQHLALTPGSVMAAPTPAAAAAPWDQTPTGSAIGGSAALQSAAAALLASISPAGLISPGEVVPAHVLKYMTPEWMRDLRQRCQQGTLQVQQLRCQLGLETPEAAPEPSAASGQHIAAAAAAPAEQPALQAAAAAAVEATPVAAAELDAGMSQSPQDLVQPSAAAQAGPGLGYGRVRGTDEAPASSSVANTTPLSHASSRGIIDKLRRRAIAQAAAATAANAAGSIVTPSPDAADAGSVARGDSPAELGIALFSEAKFAADGDAIERCDSGGSLAQYMMQQVQQQTQAQAQTQVPDHSGSASGHLMGWPNRPDCPTPGSAYSVASTPDRGSPDVFLAGLSSSRAMARQLQQELQCQLDRTASMPVIGKEVSSSSRGHRDAAARAADEQGRSFGRQGTWSSETLPRSNEVAGVPEAEAAQTEAEQVGRDVGGAEEDCAAATPDASPSPITPGAALNAGAESRLLSPGMQLQLIFDDGQGGVQAAAACDFESPAAMSAHAAHSIRAHQLSSLTAGTVTCSSCQPHSNLTPASDARGMLEPAAAAVAAAGGGPNADSQTSPGSDTQSCSAADPSLGSWVADASVACQAAPAAGAAATPSSCSASSGVVMQGSSARFKPQHISLGDSPNSTRQTGCPLSHGSAAAAASPSGAGGLSVHGSVPHSGGAAGRAAGTTAACDSTRTISSTATPSSCSTLRVVAGVALGDSPESCCGDSEDAAAEAAQFAASKDAAIIAAASGAQQSTQAVSAPAAPAGSSVAGPAVSGGSSMFATPAVVFDTPGSSAACSGDSGQLMFYTGLQQTAKSATAAAAKRPAAAPGSAAGITFAGFDSPEQSVAAPAAAPDAAAGFDSPEQSVAAPAAAPDAAAAAAADTCSLQAARSQIDLLQQLLASPGDSCCSVAGSPAWGAAPGSSNGMPVSPEDAAPEYVGSEAAAAAAEFDELVASHPVSVTFTPGDSMAASSRGSGASGTAAAAAAAVAAAFPAAAIKMGSGLPQGRKLDYAAAAAQQPGSAASRSHGASSSKLFGTSSSGHTRGTCTRSSQTPSSAEGDASPAVVSRSPAVGAALAAAQQQLVSPTLSDLGFIDAPTAADYDAAEKLQQQPGGVGGAEDLAGMTFEQRLALLCTDDEDNEGAEEREEEQASAPSDAAEAGAAEAEAAGCLAAMEMGSPVMRSAAGSPATSSCAAADSCSEEGQQEQEVHTPQLPAHLASQATQTSPQMVEVATQRSWGVRDMETQVTPALHDQHRGSSARSKANRAAAAGAAEGAGSCSSVGAVKQVQQAAAAAGSGTAVSGAARGAVQRCDVTASPAKMRDQL